MINIHFSKYFNKYTSSFISFRLCSFDLEFFFHDTYWRMRTLCKNVNKRNPSSVYGSLLLNHTMIIQCTQRFHLTKNKSYLERYVMFRASTQTSLLRCMTFKYGLLFVNKNAYGQYYGNFCSITCNLVKLRNIWNRLNKKNRMILTTRDNSPLISKQIHTPLPRLYFCDTRLFDQLLLTSTGDKVSIWKHTF